MDFSSLELVKVDINEGVAEVRLSRPRALNAINAQMLKELHTAFGALKNDASLRCVILTGDGDKAFVAGADIAEMKDMARDEAHAFSKLGHDLLLLIEDFPTPVLGAVNGYALGGGCELALACDVLYASERAKFGQPEVKLGLIPGFGGTVRLSRKVGQSVAAEWIFTGEVYGAQTAREIGLVREVLPAGELLDRVREIAKTIAARAPLAISAAKKAIVKGLATDTAGAITLEQDIFADLFNTDDMREGTGAFVEKRDPDFKGK